MIQLLEKLIAFQTTSDNQTEVKRGFEFIASVFDEKKFDVRYFEKNGVYSLLVSFKGADYLKPNILLNGHFDVVPAEDEKQFEMRIEDGRAYGRGTIDMKGMVAVLVEVMRELGKKTNPPNVALLLNGDEEMGGANGAGFIAGEIGLKPEYVLCADGPSEEKLRLTIKEKGGVWVELKARGKTAHGAYPWKGENAIEKLWDAIGKIKAFVGAMEADAWKGTVNVSIVETSNKTANKVPADARAVLDIRFTEALARTPEELVEKLRGIAPEIEMNALAMVALMFSEENHPFLQQFKKTAQDVARYEVELVYEHGATDARYFAAQGSTCIVFGAIGGNYHAEGEWVDLKSLEQNKEILLKFLRD